jgi:hypothetical protein
MRRFLVCGGIFGQADALALLESLARESRPDGILFAGYVLPRSREYASTATTAFGYTKVEMLFVERFFATLGRLGLFAAVIPGAFDAPLDSFLDLGMKAELEYPHLHMVHDTPSVEGNVAVFGLGASIDAYTDPDIGYCSRTMAEYHLRPMWTAKQSRTILLLAEAPQSWLGEGEDRRLAGSLIGSHHPDVCVIGDPHTGWGVEQLASTLILHPGGLADGSAAWLDWNRPRGHQVEFVGPRPAEGRPGPTYTTGVTSCSNQ